MRDFAGDLSQYWAAFFIGLLSLGGFGLLFVWAILSGQFSNVENPKHRLLEHEDDAEVKIDG